MVKVCNTLQNPLGLLPTLLDDQRIFTQSLAIIEYLDESFPEPPLLPANARDRAFVRALANLVAADIQPLNNLRVLDYLAQQLSVDKPLIQQWYQHWVEAGLQAGETLLERHYHSEDRRYCYGERPTIADICLIPQVYNALRFNCNLNSYPMICRIYDNCISQPVFQKAAPENQADAA